MKRDGLVDAEARHTIRDALDTTLVVEAAAGTGKTTELVQRIARVVSSGRGSVGSLIAVTFTEKAAGEMKLRLRTELDRVLIEEASDPEVHTRLRAALAELETARIGTIHALCGELLRTHPVEAGVDPAFRVADGELQHRLLRAEFERWLDSVRLAPPPGVLRVLTRARVGKGENGRDALWSAVLRLTETRDFDALYRFPAFDRAHALREVANELRALAALSKQANHARDPLARGLGTLLRGLAAVDGAGLDELEVALRTALRDRDVWAGPGRGEFFGRGLMRADVIARRDQARARLAAVMADAGAELSALLCRELREVVTRYEARKAREGVLDFFDLLLRTRALLRDAKAVRHDLARSTTHVFVDEFQDVDPVQSEILLYLASADPACDDAYGAPLVPGKLCVVGDPKQSIYRFRRADIALYDRIKQHLIARGALVATLSTSFRSSPEIQSFVNAAFAPVMSGDVARGEASYVPLAAFRASRPSQPALVALPVPSPFGRSGRVTKTAVDACTPDAVAAFVAWLVNESGYSVRERGRDVPLEARHICLLFRRFRNYDGDVTRPYVRALEQRRVRHVLSGGRAFFVREEVGALVTALSAVEWPDDTLAVYATLRGPFVGFSDDVLLQYRLHTGALSPFQIVDVATLPEALRDVADVLTLLRTLHLARNDVAIASTISHFLAALRVHAGIAIWPTGEQALGNLLRISELARSFEQKPEATSFRAFVTSLEERAERGEMADAPVVEETSDGVRMMTVHGAKGLEFPVVVLCDPCAPQRVEHPSRYIDGERGLWAQALCGAEPAELTERHAEVTAHDEAELVRLGYVAATRAMDLLVVPTTAEGPVDGWLAMFARALHPADEQKRTPRDATYRLPHFGRSAVVSVPMDVPYDEERGIAPGVHRPVAGEHDVVFWDPHTLPPSQGHLAGLSQAELLRAEGADGRDSAGLRDYTAFRDARAALRESAARPSYRVEGVTSRLLSSESGVALSAVTLVDTHAMRADTARGKRFGSLVHAIFEHLPLHASRDVLAALATALARGFGASEHECEHAQERVLNALAHPFWQRIYDASVRGEVYREAMLSQLVLEGELHEGVADLVFTEGERLVLVDFKTDNRLGDLTAYTAQLDAYARALRAARDVAVECVLLWV